MADRPPSLAERTTAGWAELERLWPDLWPSERQTYSDALLSAERYTFANRRDLAETRLSQVAAWVRAWVRPRFEGFAPEPCDPFEIGAPCTWGPARNRPAR